MNVSDDTNAKNWLAAEDLCVVVEVLASPHIIK